MTHTELTHPTDISNTSCGTVVGFIPVPRSRRLLVCQQIALRFATALKREAFALILCKREAFFVILRTPRVLSRGTSLCLSAYAHRPGVVLLCSRCV